jgi:hypothetical protein
VAEDSILPAGEADLLEPLVVHQHQRTSSTSSSSKTSYAGSITRRPSSSLSMYVRRTSPASGLTWNQDIFADTLLRGGGLTKWPGGNQQDKFADALWKAAGELDPPVSRLGCRMFSWQL